MTVKTTGAEWKRFYSDKTVWTDGSFHEDDEIVVDGALWDWGNDLMEVSDSAILALSGGTIYSGESDAFGQSTEACFRQWRKRQNTTFILCEAPKDRVAEVEAAIVAAGGRVQRL